MAEPLSSPRSSEDEQEYLPVRPLTLSDFIGQDQVKATLEIAIKAAQQRRCPLDHLLLSGPPGLGKTTLAHIIAKEMGATLRATTGPLLERPGDIAALLTQLSEGDILFIDEIHRINHVVEEVLYPAMEDFFIDVMIGEGPSARSIKIDLERFTLIGATTRQGLLGAPFRDRFGIISRLELYSPHHLEAIVTRSARLQQIPLTQEGADEIAIRSRGTPRIANRLLRRVRDYALVKGDGTIDREVADRALTHLQIDKKGLDLLDRRILQVISQDFGGGPVGVKTLSLSIGEEVQTIEEVYEPYLVQIGFLKRTPQGREITPAAREHLLSYNSARDIKENEKFR